ncbi:MAG: repeat-associated core domain protein [Clostridiales bacterium]|jgi:subtilisin family serine protease|nr:repeat-associated core domain protein [Clostridiales bacterium]
MIKKKYIIFILLLTLGTLLISKMSLGNYTGKQWAIDNKGQTINGIKGKKGIDINILDVWNTTKGSKDVIVGIIDTGISINNSSIKNSIFVNNLEIPNNSIDDDKNGYIDDISGWNFYDNNNHVYSDFLADYHGTIIAGIIGSSHNKGNYYGVAPAVKLLPLKCFAGSSGSLDDAVSAIEYAYTMGVQIINISWDSLINDDKLYQTIQKYDDILFVCSAGKNMNDLSKSPIYPACYDLNNIISVAAVNNKGALYDFSGYGLTVDVAAPGVNIYSMLPDKEFIFSNGTSMATAYVTGIAALLLSEYPNLSTDTLKSILISGSMDIESLSNKVASSGIIDAKRCFDEANKIYN